MLFQKQSIYSIELVGEQKCEKETSMLVFFVNNE
jgi:hypothetical protein